MRVEPFKPEHLLSLSLQDSQPFVHAALENTGYAQALSEHQAWTAFDDARVLGCAGVITIWPGRYQAWAVLTADIGARHFISIHRAVVRFLALQGGRVEAVVADGFEAGHRWMRMLGFVRETPKPMFGWLPNGAAAVQYARVG